MAYGSSFVGYGAGGNYYGFLADDSQLLSLNSSQLPYNSLNSDVDGRYIFAVRDGSVFPNLPLLVPEPETYAMLLAGLGVIAGVARRRSKR
ncbi:MAG: PEP-CTERM sorting domain-containing protein [Azoarcus sp.]|jgi:hypothetical protein|nr:PEP-CTERM sorting domain-containing protein [Azoarcus sp.]